MQMAMMQMEGQMEQLGQTAQREEALLQQATGKTATPQQSAMPGAQLWQNSAMPWNMQVGQGGAFPQGLAFPQMMQSPLMPPQQQMDAPLQGNQMMQTPLMPPQQQMAAPLHGNQMMPQQAAMMQQQPPQTAFVQGSQMTPTMPQQAMFVQPQPQNIWQIPMAMQR